MRILIAEDTKDMNRVLKVAFEHVGYEVDSAFDGEEAIHYIENNGYDVVVLDIMMPKKDGIEVLTWMRQMHIITPVLMLTAKAEVDDRVLGLDAGADDYLTKPFAMKELMARVNAMVRRNREYESVEDTFGDIRLNGDTLELSCENAVRLSAKEYELLKVMIQNQSRTVDTEYLLQQVWGSNTDATEETVWFYICYLRGKLKSVISSVEIQGERGGTFQLVTR